MTEVVQWATILSPIIAVIIAWLTSRKSSQDTAKKIASVEESTRRQVESMKKLAKLQIETSQIQLDKELWEAYAKQSQASKKKADMANPLLRLVSDDSFTNERNLSYEHDYQQQYAQYLKKCQSRLNELYQQMEEE